MTKRQFAIIFTLMALIVCVGVLASKLNKDGFNDPGDLGAVLQQNDDEITDEEKETLSTQDYFYNMRAAKEQEDSLYVGYALKVTKRSLCIHFSCVGWIKDKHEMAAS